jgi:nucleoside-diphosphate-sugar epimerase
MNSECLLVTGASGLVGRMLIPVLQKHRPDRSIIALVRQPEQAARLEKQGVRTVLGDLAKPRLGLSRTDYRRLEKGVTEILHAAANVRFDLPLEKSRVVNVGGVVEILQLAQSCARLRKFGHVSTTFVNGYRQGVFDEEPVAPGQEFINGYQQTKFEAEGVVLEAMRYIPASIYRIPVLLADCEDGVVSQFGYTHHLIRMLPDCILPVIPGDADVLIDMAPADWVAASLAFVFDFRFTEAAIRHLCAGVHRSMRLGDILAGISRAIERHPSYPRGRSVRFPRLVNIAEYEDFIKNCGDRSLRFVAYAMGRHVHIMGMHQGYLTRKAQADLAGSGLLLPDMLRCLENTVTYCLNTEWGRKPLEHQDYAAYATN